MIENRVVRNEERDKRLDHRSARNTFTNLIADGTNCSRFEAENTRQGIDPYFGRGHESQGVVLIIAEPFEQIARFAFFESPALPLLSFGRRTFCLCFMEDLSTHPPSSIFLLLIAAK